MSYAFELAIIGAGPSGCAAALAAARSGMSVAVFEPQPLPDKPCGEGILPSGIAALKALEFQGLLARAHPLTRIRYVLASGREVEIALPEPGFALERPVLSAALTRALASESRIRLFPRHVTSRRDARGFHLQGGEETWSTRTLIAADGLAGEGASWLRDSRATPERYGLRARAEARVPLEHVEVHLGGTSEVYLTPLGANRINVAVLRSALPTGERTSAAWLASALREHPRAARVLGDWITPPEARALGHAQPRRVASHGAFLAGDAAGSIDPVLGCGVAVALDTGLMAARAAALVLQHGSGTPEREYARFVRRETAFRRALARGLVSLSHNPRLQELVARLLRASPSLGTLLAEKVAGGTERAQMRNNASAAAPTQ
jgi:flavin-dependent dehydrogenase